MSLTFNWDGDLNVNGEIKKDGVPINTNITIEDIRSNYIDNSNFSVNTNGEAEYTYVDTSIYTVDRWYIDGGSLIPTENGIQFVNPNTADGGTSSLIRLKQNIHYGFDEFAGKTLTLSTKIDGTIYTGTATIPTEKPTEGTAVQYITAGITDFGINLNYSITGDYFVPYIALAYSRTINVEWMKLEVNDEFSGYVEPDYMTELIKINFTTPDKGDLDIPTGGESYDDTEIKEDVATLETSLENKLDINGSANNLEYTDYTKELVENTETQINPAYYPTYGTIVELSSIMPEAPQLYGFKKMSDKYYFYGSSYLAYTDDLSTLSTDTVTTIITQQSNIGGLPIRDVCTYYENEDLIYLLCDGSQAYTYTDLTPNQVYTVSFAEGTGSINNFITIGEKIYGLDTTNNNIYFYNQELGGIWELELEMGKTVSAVELYAQDSNGCTVIPLTNDIAYYVPNEGRWVLCTERDGFESMETIKHIVCLDDVFHYLTENTQQGQNTWDNSADMWESLPWDIGVTASGVFTGSVTDGYMFAGNGMLFYTQSQELWFADANLDTLSDIMGNIIIHASMGKLPYIYSKGAIYLLLEYTRMAKIEFVVEKKMLTEDVSALKNKIRTLEALVEDLSTRLENAGF